jgi:hypothetical protein
MLQKQRRDCEADSFEYSSTDDGKETREGRRAIAIPRLVHLHRRVGAPHSQDCHEFDLSAVGMFDWSLNMKASLCTGGRASVGRLLAEAKDYSPVGFVVNGYFRGLPAMVV